MEVFFSKWPYFVFFASAVVSSAGSFHFWTKQARKWNLLDHPGPRKIHTGSVPLSGGLIVGTGILLPLLTAVCLSEFSFLEDSFLSFSVSQLKRHTIQIVAIVCGVLMMLVLGIWDDFKDLSAAVKFSAQFLVAGIAVATGVQIEIFDSALLNYALTLLWILALINAFNFSDGMNGLCAGLAGISSTAVAIYSVTSGQYRIASLSFLVVGALIGFLPFNFPKAKTFLGNSGSHLTGYLVAILAILSFFDVRRGGIYPQEEVIFLAPLLIMGVVLLDLIWVMFYRLRHKKPVHIGDTNHLAHQLVKRGFTEREAVGLLWMVHGLLVAGSFLFLLP